MSITLNFLYVITTRRQLTHNSLQSSTGKGFMSARCAGKFSRSSLPFSAILDCHETYFACCLGFSWGSLMSQEAVTATLCSGGIGCEFFGKFIGGYCITKYFSKEVNSPFPGVFP